MWQVDYGNADYHGRDFAVGLEIFDDLALVRRFNSREEAGVTGRLGLVGLRQVVKLSTSVGLGVGRLRLTEHPDTTTDRLRRRLIVQHSHVHIGCYEVRYRKLNTR